MEDASTPWNGEWEMAVVVVAGRSGQERSSLRDTLFGFRLAELREGIWCRPANLRRPNTYIHDPVLSCFRSRAEGDPIEMAARLWDLDAWASTGTDIVERLARCETPATKLSVAAQLVRHLNLDPLLPVELQPPGWPGTQLRAAYAEYQNELLGFVELA